ncbi:MAG: DUF2938 domain-containing protein [Sneathiella sp.]
MSETVNFIIDAVVIGTGATLVMDLWALLQKRLFSIPSLDYGMVGRWIGHLPHGHFIHRPIMASPKVTGETVIGWSAHYLIGILFAGILIFITDPEWIKAPTFFPALAMGVGSIIAPFFILQPGMGAGIAARKTPVPMTARLRSVIAHTSFGVGLYVAALLASQRAVF